MVRFLSTLIECFSSIIFIVPAMIILQHIVFKQHNFRKWIMVFLFAFYLTGVFSVTGIPNAYSLKLEFGFHFLPFIDIVNSPADYLKNTVLNVILFLPMGFLLPIVWKEYRSAKNTIYMGLAVSVMIEVLQIFTYRLTDIDDLITNTAGTFFGFWIAKRISFQLPLKLQTNGKNHSEIYEPVIIIGTVLLIFFFLKPMVSNTVWDLILSGSWWESIR